MDRANPRTRYRDEIRSEIKELAERQLADVGPAGLSLTAIAREMGMSGPALYRYFPSRDALLVDIINDAYNDLADSLEAAVSGIEVGASLATFASSYRSWALAQPHRYRLLYQPPVPGFDANDERLVASAERSMRALQAVLASATGEERGVTGQGSARPSEPEVGRAVRIWSRLHGFVSLEIAGNFERLVRRTDELFELEVSSLTC